MPQNDNTATEQVKADAQFNGFIEHEFEQKLKDDPGETTEQKFKNILKNTNLWWWQRNRLARDLANGYDALKKEMSDPSGITEANKNSRLGRAAGAYEKFYQAMHRTADLLSEPSNLSYAARNPAASEASAALGHQAMFMATNRAFFSETQRRLSETAVTPAMQSRSLNDIFADSRIINITAVKGEEHGMLHTVYKQTVGFEELVDGERKTVNRDVRVKPGEMQTSQFETVDRVFNTKLAVDLAGEDRSLSKAQRDELQRKAKSAAVDYGQKVGMGILPKSVGFSDRTFHNDSALRDRGENIVGRMCGFGDIIVGSRTGMDNETGVVSVMDSARGVQAKDTVLAGSGIRDYDAHHDVIKSRIAEKGLKDIPDATHIDPFNASLQTEIVKLGVVDFISGQFDRHVGNFFIASDDGNPPKYKLTGIDNDSSFSSLKNHAELNLDEAVPFVTQEIRDNVLAINEDEMRGALMTTVGLKENGEQAVDLAMDRVRRLKEHVQRPELLAQESQLGVASGHMLFHERENEKDTRSVGGHLFHFCAPYAKMDVEDTAFEQRVSEKREEDRAAARAARTARTPAARNSGGRRM